MKYLKIIIPIMIFSLLSGCYFNDPKYVNIKSKEIPNYYSNEINSKLLNNQDYSVEIFNDNLYKKTKIDDSEKVIIDNFINSLSNDSFTNTEKPTTTEIYQIRVKFDDQKYIIKIYNETTVTVSPWDGIYQEDLIDMKNIPKRYNLLDFCKNVENRININQ